MTSFGPTFEAELEAAGLRGLPFVVNHDTGTVTGVDNLPPETAAKLQAVIDAHNPNNGVVPASVTPHQARLAFLQAGLLDQVETAINTAGGATKITWEFATTIERNSPLIETLRGSLGLTDEQIDTLFRFAATQ